MNGSKIQAQEFTATVSKMGSRLIINIPAKIENIKAGDKIKLTIIPQKVEK